MTKMPTAAQLKSLYRVGYQLTYIMLQPIHLLCVDYVLTIEVTTFTY